MRVEREKKTPGARMEKTDNAVELSGVLFYFPAARRSFSRLKRLDGGGRRGPRTLGHQEMLFSPRLSKSMRREKRAVLMDIIWWALNGEIVCRFSISRLRYSEA